MYFQEMWPMEKILPFITCNPANFLKLKGELLGGGAGTK
jgi:hypothetical protein